jgi:spermidine synthase
MFFLSGAAGLIYEVVWMRMLALVFGATAFATSTILASFMAGLALGSFYFSRVIERGASPLRVYALLEAGIGVFAFLMPVIFAGLDNVYVALSRQFPMSFYAFSLVRFVLSFLVLLIPTTLMGGTLPVLGKYLVDRTESLGWNIGRLYAINTFGAVLGCFSAGFFLIMIVGVRESAYIAGAVNFLIAGTVWALERGSGKSRTAGLDLKVSEECRNGGGRDAYPAKIARLALWAAAVSGFCALAYEVFWTRALVFLLDNTTHAFTTMLATFLSGLAIGSLAIAKFIDSRRKLVAWLGAIEALIGISVILSIFAFGQLSSRLESGVGDASSMGFWRWTGLRFMYSFAILLVPTVLMGMTFPIFSKIYTRHIKEVGRALGSLYSVNTVGSILGSVIAGFVLIPLIGVVPGLVFVAFISASIGALLILHEPSVRSARRWKAAAGLGLFVIVIGGAALTAGKVTFASPMEKLKDTKVLFYKEGVGATVKVIEEARGNKYVSIDGFPVAGTSFTAHDIQKALGHVPIFLSPVPFPSVNIIGFGAGGTSYAFTRHPVKEVDCVELVPAVIEAARWFPEVNHGVLDHPRYRVIIGDGRNYALVTDKKYDVISIDATSPKCAGNGSLYALEFYALCKKNLTPSGLAVEWLPIHLLSDKETRMIVRTFQTVFPHTTLWFTPARTYCLLVGTQEELVIDFRSLSEKLAAPDIQRELAPLFMTDPLDFLSCFVMGEEAVKAYAGGARINTDNHPYLEFTPSLAYFVPAKFHVQNTAAIAKSRESVLPLLTGLGRTEGEAASVKKGYRKRFEATQYSLSGEVFAFQDKLEEAIGDYRQALSVDPDDKLTRYLLESAKAKLKHSDLVRGLSHHANGRYEDAINEFRKAIAIDPDFVAARTSLAVSYMNAGMYEKAKLELIKVLELDPRHENARDALKKLEELGY